MEQRRADSTRGGLATYVRKPLQIESSSGNEYGLHTKIILPNSQRINVINTYIPPATSLKKRHILESDATTKLENVLDIIQPQITTIICGDFNARIGSKIPNLETEHPPRQSLDKHICPRAPWLLQLCELYQLYILNGIHTPATYTCHTSRGNSTIDLILSNTMAIQVHTEPSQTYKISDHDLVYTYLPLSVPHTYHKVSPYPVIHTT